VQKLHLGQEAFTAFTPECKNGIQASRDAKFALQVNANNARLVSAEFARDSY